MGHKNPISFSLLGGRREHPLVKNLSSLFFCLLRAFGSKLFLGGCFTMEVMDIDAIVAEIEGEAV
jgi:hypothetical protein